MLIINLLKNIILIIIKGIKIYSNKLIKLILSSLILTPNPNTKMIEITIKQPLIHLLPIPPKINTNTKTINTNHNEEIHHNIEHIIIINLIDQEILEIMDGKLINGKKNNIKIHFKLSKNLNNNNLIKLIWKDKESDNNNNNNNILENNIIGNNSKKLKNG
jgi:hypothetical protein